MFGGNNTDHVELTVRVYEFSESKLVVNLMIKFEMHKNQNSKQN